MIMRTLIAIGATAAVSLLAAAPVAATFPGANGRIVFENQWKGGVWTMRPDGSDLQRLQPGSAPSWSANGRWIVYVCFPENETYDQVCMMRADGSNVRQITHGGLPASDPSFSPGGGRVIFYREGLHSDPGGLFMINTDGSHEHVLTQDAGPAEWAPDGRHIAYDGPGGVWIMRPNGSHRRVLYSGGYFPHYAPSSRSILFYANGTMMRMGAAAPTPTRSTRARSTSMPRCRRPGAAYSGS